MTVRRIMPYHESPDFDATRAFYTRVLGLEEGDFGGGYIGFGSGRAQVLFAPPGVEPVLPDMGVDVDSREAVDVAHAKAVEAGHEVIYGPVDEPWGVRRFLFAIRTRRDQRAGPRVVPAGSRRRPAGELCDHRSVPDGGQEPDWQLEWEAEQRAVLAGNRRGRLPSPGRQARRG